MKATKDIFANYLNKRLKVSHENKPLWTTADMIQGFCAGIGIGVTVGLLIAFVLIYQI